MFPFEKTCIRFFLLKRNTCHFFLRFHVFKLFSFFFSYDFSNHFCYSFNQSDFCHFQLFWDSAQYVLMLCLQEKHMMFLQSPHSCLAKWQVILVGEGAEKKGQFFVYLGHFQLIFWMLKNILRFLVCHLQNEYINLH